MPQRYTQVDTFTVNPLSAQEIMMVPLAKQQKHDQYADFLGEVNQVQANALESDRETADREISAFREASDKISDTIMTKGISRGMSQDIIKLRRKIQDSMSGTGTVGKIQANYNTAMANIAEIQKRTDMDESHKKLLIQTLLDEYNQKQEDGTYAGGVANNAQWNTEYGWKKMNMQDKLRDLAKDIKPQILKNAQPILNDKKEIIGYTSNGWNITPLQDGQLLWEKDGKKTTKLPPAELYKHLSALASTDSDIKEYLNNLSRINIDGTQELQKALENVSYAQAIHNIEYDPQFRITNPPKGSKLAQDGKTGQYYNILEIPEATKETAKLFNEETISEPYVNPEITETKRALFSGFSYQVGTGEKKDSEVLEAEKQEKWENKVEKLSKEEKEYYNKVGTSIFRDSGEKFNLNNRKHADKLREYIQEADEYIVSDPLTLLDPAVDMAKSQIAGQIPSTDKKGLDEWVNKQAKFSFFIDINNPETVHAKENGLLSTKDGNYSFNENAKFEFSAIVDWDSPVLNMIPKNVRDTYAKDFVSPILVTRNSIDENGDIKEQHTFLMSRAHGDTTLSNSAREGIVEYNKTMEQLNITPTLRKGEEIYTDFPIANMETGETVYVPMAYYPKEKVFETLLTPLFETLFPFEGNVESSMQGITEQEENTSAFSQDNAPLIRLDDPIKRMAYTHKLSTQDDISRKINEYLNALVIDPQGTYNKIMTEKAEQGEDGKVIFNYNVDFNEVEYEGIREMAKNLIIILQSNTKGIYGYSPLGEDAYRYSFIKDLVTEDILKENTSQRLQLKK